MNNIWNKVYSDYSSFFGDQQSKFALMCYEKFVNHKVKKVLELGCGQGRDSLFFASKGLDVTAIDSSEVAIENLTIKAKEMNIDIKLKNISALEGIPYPDNYFDTVYSHMFYNMGFNDNELKFLFSESNRVLKNKVYYHFLLEVRKILCIKYQQAYFIVNIILYIFKIN